MSLSQQVDRLDNYKKFLAAGGTLATSATCDNLVKFLVTEERAPVLDQQNRDYVGIGRVTSFGPRTPPRSDIESYLDQPPDLLSDPLGSPFDLLDEMLPDEEKIIKLINFITDKSEIPFALELAARLSFLFEAVKEDSDEVPIPPESLSNFISFLQNTPNLKCPDVVLTPSSEIRAQWRTGPNHHFAVVFMATGATRYVIFTPNPRDPDKIDRLSGMTSVDALMDTAEPHGVLEWVTQ